MNDARDRFAPLTDIEGAVSGVSDPKDGRFREDVSSIPADAPPPPNNHLSLDQRSNLTRHDETRSAIGETHRVDEVNGTRDKAPENVPFPCRQYPLKFRDDELPFHPLSKIFPLMESQALVDLKDDIGEHGLNDPITLFEGKVLDGRNRFLACHGLAVERGWPESGVEPAVHFVQFNGPDPLAFVLSANLKRRHLDESQRAMIAARIANLSEGRPEATKTASRDAVSQTDAAKSVGVSRRSVQRAKEVFDNGVPELVKAVESGAIPVKVAATLSRHSKNVQVAAVEDPKKAAHMAKKAIREKRQTDLAGKLTALPTKKYGVILADPPWRFEVYSRETGMNAAADNHYPTSELDEIKALDVPSVAADDCVLFLWATAPMMPQALEVMQAWGFTYKAQAVWAKDRTGTGYWFRNRHELLLVGTRGNVPAPTPGTQPDSVIEAPRGSHSEKPEVFLEMVERLFPNLPKIELNRRGPARPGWDAWGLEAA